MTSIPTISDPIQPRQLAISNRTLIVGAGGQRVLAVLNGRDPLLLPPGSVLHLGDPPGQLVVTKVSVIAGGDVGDVCLEAEPVPGHYRAPAGASRPAQRLGHLRLVPSRPPQWSGMRPGDD